MLLPEAHREISRNNAPASYARDFASGAEALDVLSASTTRLRLRRSIEQMTSAGWCYHQVLFLARSIELKAFEQLASLPKIREDDHSSCRRNGLCVAHNVNNETYRTRHCTTDCDREILSVPQEELTTIIGAGHIPLVSIDRNDEKQKDSPFELKLHRRDENSSYTAVSHVWADGLGNPHDNALPTCQLQKLSIILRHLEMSSKKGCCTAISV
ncbi:hypothetical protein CC86DRAFT_368266 [Ophiobolus disseminans]|uniref:Heterokaryon incompatibility domain-containing protein n=1 Tax=Ophiobolus disseminans TaxID=1469910 RepID=A0A6A7A7E9_9PLEO|nr:hypothetical protein CC86DRAFT_368266 [Ophiobolus disseminans]